MLCENCKKRPANVKYTQIINGIKQEIHLCEECSKNLGLNDFGFDMPINFSSFFGDFLNEYNNGFLPLMEKEKPLVCDKCKMTYDEFVENGKFGCSNCYEVFSANIDPILKRLHGGNRYTGRKAKNSTLTQSDLQTKEEKSESKLDELKKELKKMIKEEKYEEAAKIRDEIKKIEGKKEA